MEPMDSMNSTTGLRDAREVLEDHLREATQGSIDDDLQKNYAEDVVVLTSDGVHRGHEGVREINGHLQREIPDARYRWDSILVEGEFAFLEWSARSGQARVDDAVDTYVIRDGRIVAQTIHYAVVREHSDQ